MSTDVSNNLVIKTIANGATAQLRTVLEHADRETAQPIYRELLRLAHQLAHKHDFQLGRQTRVAAVVVVER